MTVLLSVIRVSKNPAQFTGDCCDSESFADLGSLHQYALKSFCDALFLYNDAAPFSVYSRHLSSTVTTPSIMKSKSSWPQHSAANQQDKSCVSMAMWKAGEDSSLKNKKKGVVSGELCFLWRVWVDDQNVRHHPSNGHTAEHRLWLLHAKKMQVAINLTYTGYEHVDMLYLCSTQDSAPVSTHLT